MAKRAPKAVTRLRHKHVTGSKVCPVCGEKFTKTWQRHGADYKFNKPYKNAVYCSSVCRQRAYNQRLRDKRPQHSYDTRSVAQLERRNRERTEAQRLGCYNPFGIGGRRPWGFVTGLTVAREHKAKK